MIIGKGPEEFKLIINLGMPHVLGPVFVLMCVVAWGTQHIIVLLISMSTMFFL